MHRRLLVLALAALALGAPASANALEVHVRVEGAGATIFGATRPLVTPFVGKLDLPGGATLDLDRPTALGALEAASERGEFYYRMESTAFGPYVAQIGRRTGEEASGWVYKVNGVSPPVGADAYALEEGDEVLWYYATFGNTGGPATLELERVARRCFQAFAVDDTGARERARDVVFRRDGRRIRDADGRICLRGHWHRLKVLKQGAIRSAAIAR